MQIVLQEITGEYVNADLVLQAILMALHVLQFLLLLIQAVKLIVNVQVRKPALVEIVIIHVRLSDLVLQMQNVSFTVPYP